MPWRGLAACIPGRCMVFASLLAFSISSLVVLRLCENYYARAVGDSMVLPLSARDVWSMVCAPEGLWWRTKRVRCPQCRKKRRSLYIVPSLAICCAACLPAHGIDPKNPDRPVSQREIAQARRRLAELSPLSAPITDPPLDSAPNSETRRRGPGRPRKGQERSKKPRDPENG